MLENIIILAIGIVIGVCNPLVIKIAKFFYGKLAALVNIFTTPK